MMVTLSGTRPGHALFTQDSRAVVVDLDTMTASAVFPDYEVIPAQWESDADPTLVPTRAFALADEALADVVAVTASGKRSGKRTYAVPKNVRDTASRALARSLGNPIERSVAAALTAGKPVSYDLVHHVSLYFSRPLTASADLWGGDAGARWAEKISAKESAIRAAAAAPHDLGLSERGAKNPAPADEAIEDDPGPEVVWGDVDPTETHVFSPLSVANPYDCAYCFAPEGALLHTDSMRAQVVANYGEDSPELAAYDEYLATFDEPSEEALTAKPVSAAGRFAVDSPRGAASLVAAAFFHDAEDCEYHAEHDRDADEIHRIYGHWGDDTWRAWNPQAKDWEDAGDASDADLEPIDDNSAYVVAMRQAENGGGPVPVRDVHTMEWAAADDARADIDDEVGGFEEMDPDFYVETDDEDDTHVDDLYAQRSGLWFRWDAETADWVASPEPVNVSEIDEEDAEQVARWLSWGREGMDPGDDSVTAAARRKTGTRAPRANQPGQVPRPSSRVRGSERSPYSSWSTSPGSNWFRKAGKPSEFFAPGKYGPGSAEIAAEDGNYTPEERAANAKKQVRDAYGRFAKGGSEIDTAKGTGTIVKINPETQQIQVRYSDGSTAWVDAKQTRVHGANEKAEAKDSSPYRTTNDGGEVWLPADGPRATKYTPKAYLSKLQKPLTSAELDKMLADTSRYFAEERARARRINRNWNSSDAITASANHDGVMVAFFLPPDQAASHALEGGEPAESLHLTLAYLGSMDEVPGGAQDLLRVVGEWAQGIAPVSGEISGSGVFVNGEKPVTHLSVDCSDLPAVRQSLIEHLEANGYSPRKDHGFDPHITLAYDDVPVEVSAEPVHFNDVVVSFGPTDMAVPLGGMAMSAAGEEKALTPDTSDVKPINMAIVDTVDKSAVLELLSLVPASTTSTTPVLFKRTAKGWERDDNMLSSLRSAAPPPVVTLDEQTFPGVLKQVDATLSGAGQDAPAEQAPVAASGAPELYNEYGELLPALVAAAGQAVTPKDFAGAERLKRYWTVGPGGAKIRWGQGGDFNRCVKHLTKYLGPRAKGYCFSGDTEFTTRDGVMTFEDAVGTTQLVLTQAAPSSDRAQGHRKDGYWVEAEIQPFGEQRLLSVTLTRSGQTKVIRATPEHRWFASEDSKSWKRLSVSEMTTADLRPGMALAALSPKNLTGRSVPSPFGVAAGIVYGDGTLDSTRGAMIDLWGEKDAYLLRYFEGCSLGVCKKESTGLLGTRVRGLPASWKSLPSLEEGHSYLYGWLAGYIAADGSVSKNGAVTLYSADLASLEHARIIATRLGIETLSILTYERAGIDGTVSPLHRLRFLGSSVPADLLIIPEHRARFEAAEKAQSPIRWRVVSVEDHGEVEQVYCAVVPETETFVLTDGIWTHNCQLRHHDVLGFYTGTHAKMLRGGRRGVRGAAFELTDEQVSTELQAVRERLAALPIVADAGGAGGGARFRIPIVVPEGVPTGDGRVFKPLSVTHRDLPIPLLWQIKTGEGHDGSVIVGRIDSMERVANGLGNAYGVFDTSPHGQEVERLVREGFLRGVSADLDNFEAQTEKAKELGEKKDDDEPEKIGADKTTISKARVMAVTAVPKPAFQECTIEIVPDEPEQQEVPVIHDGVYSDREDEALVACAMVASQIPVTPPADWFEDPMLREPTPLTVTDDGRVYGHIAAWHTDHIGLPFGTKPPRSRSDYAFFHTGVVRTEGGKDVPVGQLTLAGGHAGLELTADAAVKHYDDTHSAVADVHAGEDAHGIWVAGALRPDVDAAKIRTLRASAPSGDWRPINGRLELVAVCQVNVPGFPVARARVASGYVTALVAAGAAPLARMKGLSVEDRVQRLEQEALAAKMQAARERMAPALAEHAETLALRASAARERIEALRAGADTGYDAEQLEAFSRKGWALPNGSLAIANVADLRAAVVAYSSLAACDKPGARRHIMKRARGLGHVDLIPASWTSASVEERYQDARSTFLELAASKSLTASGSQVLPRVSAEDGDRGLLVKRDNVIERMKALRAAAKTPSGEFDAQRHPRWDENGQFRQVLTRLRKDVEDVPEAKEAVRNIDKAMELMSSSDLGKIEAATHDVMRSIDKAADLVGSAETAANMRTGFAALGEALARLPLPQGNDTATMRWTDLPEQLQSLVTDVMGKLKSELDADEYRKVTHDVQAFQSGVDFATSDQIQSWLSGMVSRLVA